MAKYITLKVDDETFDQLRLHTKHREVWLGSPTCDWSPKRAFLDGSDFERSSLGRNLDAELGNTYFVDDEVFENIRQATEQLVSSAFQAGSMELKNAELFMQDFDESLEPNRPE